MSITNYKINEALCILQAKCAEVIQVVSKIYRFGAETRWPFTGSPRNVDLLEEELGDLLAMMEILVDEGLIRREKIQLASHRKKLKLKEFSKHLGKTVDKLTS